MVRLKSNQNMLLGSAICFNFSILFCLVSLSSEVINFSIEPVDAVVKNGSSVNIDCVVSTTNNYGIILAVNWKHNSNFITDFNGNNYKQLSNNTLHFYTFTKSDEGTYSCSANVVNKDDKRVIGQKFSRVARLQIAFIDSLFLDYPKGIIKKDIKETIHLTCISPASLPQPIIYWENNGHTLSGYQNYSEVNNNSISNTLELSKFSYEDLGQYRCCVFNSLLMKRLCSPYFELTLKIRQNLPYFVIQPNNYSMAVRYSSFRLDCVILGNPLPVITWQKNEFDLTTSSIQKNGSLYLNEIERSDKGQYTCTGTNKEGSIRSLPALVAVAFIDFDFRKDPEDGIIFFGKTIFIHCISPDSYPEKNVILWYKDIKIIVPDKRIRILKNGTLKISPSRLSDDGNYFCEAHNELADQRRTSKIAKITVHIVPTLGISGNDISIIEGSSLLIDCEGNRIPFPNVKLFKKLNSSLMMLSDNGSYFIDKVGTNHQGYYVCTAKNIDGFAEKLIAVNVLTKVKPLIVPSNVTLLVGKQLVLFCSFSGNPIPNLHWEFMDSNGIKKLVKNSSKIGIFSNKLVVSDLQKVNEGWFYCIGNNYVNTFILQYFVKVHVLPTIHRISKNSTAKLREVTQLSCTVYSDPECIISWRYRRNTISNSSKYILLERKTEKNNLVQLTHDLFIKSSTFDDTGKYTCICKNNIGSVESLTYVDIQMVPKIESFYLKSRFYYGDQVEIKCFSFGMPLPSLRLHHNGSLISQNNKLENERTSLLYILKNVTSRDSGIYMCKSNNSLGGDVVTKNIIIMLPPSSPQLNKPIVLSSSSILLSWELSFNGFSKALEIMLEVASKNENKTYSISPKINKYKIDNLQPFFVYEFKIKVRNKVGFSNYSRIAMATTLQGAPSSPLNVSFSNVASRSFLLTWYKPLHMNGIITLYQIFIYGKSNFTYNYTVKNENIKLSYKVDSLIPYTKYHVLMRAATTTRSHLNFGNFSNKVYVATNEEKPGAVQNTQVDIIDISTVNVTWENPSEPNGRIICYHVLIKNMYMKVLMTTNTTNNYIIVENLNPYSKYFAFIHAENSAGKGIIRSRISILIGIHRTKQQTTLIPTKSLNSSTPIGTLVLHHDWFDRDYLILFVGISAFALILLFAIFTTIFARCMCAKKTISKSEAPSVYLDDVGNLNANSQCPNYLVTDSPDLIFEETDSFENMIERMENEDLSLQDGYNCVEPYQGRPVPKSPLVKLTGSKMSSTRSRSIVKEQKSVYEFSNGSYSPDSATEVSVVDLIDAFLENEKWYIEDGTLRRSSHNKSRPCEMML